MKASQILKNNRENIKVVLEESIPQLAAENPDIEVVWLYGSRARNTHRPDSDIDLAIAYKNFKLDPLEKVSRPVITASDWQAALNTQVKISVVDINQIPIYLAFSVISEGKVLYSNNDYRMYKEEDRIMALYEYQMIQSQKRGN
ncbi:type VII toxin-antitoxin system MntA family adenylyltransferase antitoxin [Catenovulum agarivorans]|uniref:type VII toxin-antitoxin system MntA family adenylyltransferase antitoxin n=1 Tax=Catenovulum agarivorans TaxID=1172192 RepID=UPI0004AD116D|nr:nucleotidyltransferase domain-containing protein [Catenovulum agarivorans]